MAPSRVAARSNGISITSASVKKGHPTVVKYTWTFHDDSPKFFAVGIIEVSSHDFTLLEDDVETRGHGGSGSGKDTVSIEELKNYPGKYTLVLVDINDYDNVFATSKAFQVKKNPHIAVRQKTASLLNELLLPDETLPSFPPSPLQTSDLTRSAIDTHDILSSLTSSIANPKPFGWNVGQTRPKADDEEKAVRGVVTYWEGMKGSQTDVRGGVKSDLRAIFKERKTERGKGWGLEEDGWDVLQRHAE